MALPIFTPPRALSQTNEAPEIKLNEFEYGEGYTELSPAGLNHIRRVETHTWRELLLLEAQEILGFLRSRGGFAPFWWTPPFEASAVKWTCKEWSSQKAPPNLVTVTATFRQSFSLET